MVDIEGGRAEHRHGEAATIPHHTEYRQGGVSMIDRDEWVGNLAQKLRDAFGERLLFVGLQGSYRRGEATESSDIDIVVVFDRLGVDDLERYRAVVRTMPESAKACGFVSGREELLGWPKFEIFQMRQETEAIHGTLEGLVPRTSRADIAKSVEIGAANAYHALCHAFLYDDEDAQRATLAGIYKGAFFLLQLRHYLRAGQYIPTKREMLPLLQDDERDILFVSMQKGQPLAGEPAEHFRKLIAWAGGILRTGGEIPNSAL